MTRRIQWPLFLIPAVLSLIALSTRCITHPVAFNFFAPAFSLLSLKQDPVGSSFPDFVDLEGRRPHYTYPEKRSPGDNDTSASSSSIVSGSLSSEPAATSTLPSSLQSVPNAPTSTIAIPTPFPQPFDTTLSNNFSTQGCSAFFTNMTQSSAFRQCRPFSLLYKNSNALTAVS